MDIETEIRNNNNLGSGKQTLLIVLSVLTIVGNSLFLIKNFSTYNNYNDVEDYFHWEYQDVVDDYEYTLENGSKEEIESHEITKYTAVANAAKLSYLIELILCLGSILGVVFMLFRRRVGYWLYFFTSLIFIMESLWFWLVIMRDDSWWWHYFILFFYIGFPIAFIILFSRLKQYFIR